MENGKNGEEKKENCKREGGKLKIGGKVPKWEDLFFFENLFWVYQSGNFLFSTGKKDFTPAKKSGKMTLPPKKKFLLGLCSPETQLKLRVQFYGTQLLILKVFVQIHQSNDVLKINIRMYALVSQYAI